ncbi:MULTISPECIES: hypothetical protein [unclassified Bilifractor]|uniref:hypothetical protein n=2 Tax=Bilifractor TaxID=2815776 RepID=UPI003F9130F8
MLMSDREIAHRFKHRSGTKFEMIGILAELNATGENEIKEALWRQGIDTDSKPGRRKQEPMENKDKETVPSIASTISKEPETKKVQKTEPELQKESEPMLIVPECALQILKSEQVRIEKSMDEKRDEISKAQEQLEGMKKRWTELDKFLEDAARMKGHTVQLG